MTASREELATPSDAVLLLVAAGSPAVKMTSALHKEEVKEEEEKEEERMREEKFSHRKPQQVR